MKKKFDYLNYKNKIPLDRVVMGKLPKLNPYSIRYKNFWRDTKRKIIEGYWVNNEEGEHQWVPPILALYNNLWTIEMSRKGSRSQNKIKGTPRLRDVEWIKGFIWAYSRGFSGFELDDEYTCSRLLSNPEEIEENILYVDGHIKESIYNSKGELKKYVPALEYLYTYKDRPLGKPQFFNPALNVADIECRNIGKAQPLDSKVLTLDGEKKFKDIGIGDRIFDDSGELTSVIGYHPRGVKDIYKVTLKDGRSAECCGEHLWTVYHRQKWITVDINKIKSTAYKVKRKSGYEEYYYRVPITKALNYNAKDLKLDPYILGAWLGDGSKSTMSLHGIDDEVINRFIEYANKNNFKVRRDSKIGYHLSGIKGVSEPPVKILRELNIYNNKHIPEEYFTSSIDQRLELLRGLLDTDGTIDKHGYISFDNINKGLVHDVERLARSLGISTTFKEKKTSWTYRGVKKYSKSYRVFMDTDMDVFFLKRKRSRIVKDVGNKRRIQRSTVAITNIEYIGDKEAACITVNNKSHLYLTNDYIVTHNSFISSAMVGQNFLSDGAMDYDELLELIKMDEAPMSETLVGAIDSKYSTGLINKLKLGLDSLPGDIEVGDMVFPSPISKKYTGSFMSGKHIISEYEKKIGNNWTKAGSKSRILHRSFGDNPFAANGTRPGFIVIDEIGFMGNLEESLGQMAECTTQDGRKFGTIWMTGTGGDMTSGACVCKGTKIFLNDGTIKNVEDLIHSDIVLGYDIENKTISRESIPYISKPSKKECVRIITHTGRKLECSIDHPILFSKWDNFRSSKTIGRKPDGKRIRKYSKKVEFREAGLLKEGYQVSIPRFNDNWGSVNEPESWLLGIAVGDGTYSGKKTSLKISNCDISINDRIKKETDYTINVSRDTTDGQFYEEITIKDKANLIKKYGMKGQSSVRKRSPNSLLSFNKQSSIDYVSGYFDADGSVTCNAIELTSISKPLLDDTLLILNKLGIHGLIRKKKTYDYKFISTDKISKLNQLYVLDVSDKISIVNFHKNIRFTSKSKQDKLEDLIIHLKTVKANKASNFEDIVFERIESIENIGLKDIYNFEAGNTNTYLANGIITHNTEAIKKVFYAPKAFDCIELDDIFEDRGKIGLFIPAWMALDDFRDELGNVNKEAALKVLLKEREIAANAKSKQKLYDLLQMKPLVPSEAFLVMDGNIFPIGELKEHLSNLESFAKGKDIGTNGWMIRGEDGKSYFKVDHERRAADYPTRDSVDENGAVVIWEHPVDNPPYGLYVAGIDPYDQDKATSSVSFGSIFIYKRFKAGESTYHVPVAEYTGRPQFANDFYEQCRRLLEYYNAKALYENQNPGLKKYFETKFCTYLLHTQPNIIKQISPNSNVNRGYGIHMPKVIKDEMEIMTRDWLKVEEEPGVLQLTKIKSIPLIKELISYNDTGNFDRVIAFMLCILIDAELHRVKLDEVKEETRIDNFFNRKLFTNN